MNRRTFAKWMAGGAAALLSPAIFLLSGCNPSDVFAKILAYANVGLQAFESVLGILQWAGLIPPGTDTVIALAIKLVKAGFADVITAVNDYNAAPAIDKATLIGKISTVLAVLQNNLTAFWNSLNIPDPALAAMIEALLGVIATTLAAFQALLPPPPVPVVGMTASARGRSRNSYISVPPVLRTEKKFKQDFNSVLGSRYLWFSPWK